MRCRWPGRALEGGATWLGVHTVGEAEVLRAGGLTAPILVMGPLTGDEWARAAAAGTELAVWSRHGITSAVHAGVPGVHLKLDTGMGRSWAHAARTSRPWWTPPPRRRRR
ncbi:MAG: alanine racemase [Thermoleophilia bacterium]